jgi:hypothetical protein
MQVICNGPLDAQRPLGLCLGSAETMKIMVARRGRSSSEEGSTVGMAWTHILIAKGEGILHGLLRIRIVWLAFGLFCKRQEEVDHDECLDQDVALESEVAQLRVVSQGFSTKYVG